MPKTKISEFSTTPGNNTDIDGINIAEGCPPSGINDAIRELMAQLKDFQAGDAGDSITVVGTLAAKGTSTSGADLKLYEDTDNGTNYVGFIAPASIASNVQWTLPSADGSSGQALQTNGSGTLSFATLGISAGGTGQTTANAAFNALAPSQTSNAGRYLKTDGTNTSWDLLDISTADITGTLPVANGGTGITSFGTGVATALGINVGSSGAFVTNGGALGTPSSGTVTNLTGTASININGTVGATTPTTGAFTTLSASGNITVSGGTANGVAYLNGSKVLTTGSALTWNGSIFNASGTLAGYGLQALPLSGAATLNLIDPNNRTLQILSPDPSGNQAKIQTTTNHEIIFGINSAEQMRLTSTGLGIGTSSPGARIQVDGANTIFDTNSVGQALIRSTTAYNATPRAGIAFSVKFTSGGAQTAGGTSIQSYKENNTDGDFATGLLFTTQANGAAPAERLRLDSSGNLGLGVTPSAWGSAYKAFQVGGTYAALYSQNDGRTVISNNVIAGSGGLTYANTSQASQYTQLAGAHYWLQAASGTAGNTISFTQAMTLDASGNLGIGATSLSVALEILRSGNSYALFRGGSATVAQGVTVGQNTGGDAYFFNGFGGAAIFGTNNTERARITSGGDLLVGTTNTSSTAGNGLKVTSGSGVADSVSIVTGATSNAGLTTYQLYSTGASAYRFYVGAGGTVFATSTTISAISDQRLKENVQDLDAGLDKIMALKPRKFDWKAGKGKDIKGDRGFIAQEFEQVFPDLIDEWKDPAPEGEEPYKSVRQDLIPVLVKAIQEQQALITDLRARVAQLEAK